MGRALVTTDFSDLANRAIPKAYSLLRSGGAVRLVHVIHPGQLPNGDFLASRRDQLFETRHAEHIKACHKKLADLIPADAAAAGILTEIEVIEHEDPAQGICQAAARWDADVICLATHGHTGLASLLLGSVAMSLLRKSKRPLYLAPGLES